MTKNSGRKKAARKYQHEHPGTTFPEALRAVARPTAEPFSMPDGYILLDQDGVPTSFEPGEATSIDLMEIAGASAVPTPSDSAAVLQTATMIESLIEHHRDALDEQDRQMLQRATSAVRAEGPQGGEYRGEKSTPNPDFLRAWLLAATTFDALLDGAQLPPEQVEAVNLQRGIMVGALAEKMKSGAQLEDLKERCLVLIDQLNEKWQHSNSPAADVQAAVSDLWKTRSPEDRAAEMGLESSSDWPTVIGLPQSDGVEYDETERAKTTSGVDVENNEWVKLQQSLDPRMAELMRSLVSSPTANLGRHNGAKQWMTTHTVEDDSAT